MTTKKQQYGITLLNRETREQREDFLTNVVTYETERLNKMITMWESRDLSSEHTKYRLESNYKYAQNAFKRITTNTMKWLNDGNEYFDTKLQQAAAKIEGFGFLEDNVMLDIVESELTSAGLSFYINGWDRNTNQSIGRIYARLIWVNCYEKQSHYRWIVTLKDAPKKVEVVAEVTEVTAPTTTRKAAGRRAQIEALLSQSMTAKQMAETLEMNVSYVRKIVRDIKQG
jgi:hypothetical protein